MTRRIRDSERKNRVVFFSAASLLASVNASLAARGEKRAHHFFAPVAVAAEDIPDGRPRLAAAAVGVRYGGGRSPRRRPPRLRRRFLPGGAAVFFRRRERRAAIHLLEIEHVVREAPHALRALQRGRGVRGDRAGGPPAGGWILRHARHRAPGAHGVGVLLAGSRSRSRTPKRRRRRARRDVVVHLVRERARARRRARGRQITRPMVRRWFASGGEGRGRRRRRPQQVARQIPLVRRALAHERGAELLGAAREELLGRAGRGRQAEGARNGYRAAKRRERLSLRSFRAARVYGGVVPKPGFVDGLAPARVPDVVPVLVPETLGAAARVHGHVVVLEHLDRGLRFPFGHERCPRAAVRFTRRARVPGTWGGARSERRRPS